MQLTSSFVFVMKNRASLIFTSFNFIEKRRFWIEIGKLKIKRKTQAARVFLMFFIFKYLNNPTPCLRVSWSTKHPSAFGPVVVCLPLSSFATRPTSWSWVQYPPRPFFLQNFPIFHVFSSNFHNFFD